MLFSRDPLSLLIILVYYNRPIWVRNSIQSVIDSTKKIRKWRIAAIDDGSEYPLEPILKELVAGRYDLYVNPSTIEDKIENGITLGKMLNQVIDDSDEDIAVTLCDDDQLYPDYLEKIERFFRSRVDVEYAYSNILLYNPLKEDAKNVTKLSGPYNQWTGDLRCSGKVDGSQVAFRLSTCREHGIRYEVSTKSQCSSNPWICSQDSDLFEKFYRKFGKAKYTGLIAQYKGVHEHQLVYFKEHVYRNQEDIINKHREILKLAGKVF